MRCGWTLPASPWRGSAGPVGAGIGHLQAGELFPALGVLDGHREVQAQVGNVRNGRPGSKASGVSTGNTVSSKYLRARVERVSVKSHNREWKCRAPAGPAAVPPGSGGPLEEPLDFAADGHQLATRGHAVWGVSTVPASAWATRPATRTMKNRPGSIPGSPETSCAQTAGWRRPAPLPTPGAGRTAATARDSGTGLGRSNRAFRRLRRANCGSVPGGIRRRGSRGGFLGGAMVGGHRLAHSTVHAAIR